MPSTKQRAKDNLAQMACLLVILDGNELDAMKRGSKRNSKNISRTRKDVDKMILELGIYARRAYRMSEVSLDMLHSELKAGIDAHFSFNDANGRSGPNGLVPSKLRLSCAIRYFAGAEVYDLILSHGMGRSTIYDSIWGIVDVVNSTPSLSLNTGGDIFPTHAEQELISQGFLERSGAGFDQVIGAVDGMLVWTEMPSKKSCRKMSCGQTSFHCARKGKYGINLLAMCDHKARFRWVDISAPGRSSDYMSWIKSGLPSVLEDPTDSSASVAEGKTIAGDNAFVKKSYMAVPFPGSGLIPSKDAYNFYLSQLRIVVECAFGIFVHRWGILRRPLSCPIEKVPPLVMCLCRLHNFCSERGESEKVARSMGQDEIRIRSRAQSSKSGGAPVALDEHGRPTALLRGGHHFRDVAGGRPAGDVGTTPMDDMLAQVERLDLKRPL